MASACHLALPQSQAPRRPQHQTGQGRFGQQEPKLCPPWPFHHPSLLSSVLHLQVSFHAAWLQMLLAPITPSLPHCPGRTVAPRCSPTSWAPPLLQHPAEPTLRQRL